MEAANVSPVGYTPPFSLYQKSPTGISGSSVDNKNIRQTRKLEPSIAKLLLHNTEMLHGELHGDMSGTEMALATVSTASMAVSAYHGYKRNNSIGWAICWGFCGGLFPIITPVIAYAQGFGKEINSDHTAGKK